MKVVIDRLSCVSCKTCCETCPAFFEQNMNDMFSQIVEKYRLDKDKEVGIPPPELEGSVMDAIDLCPAQVIAVKQ
ncbi:MAG: ferredoxin [Methanoregula sp.]|jgi:ferredoxin